MQYRVNRKWTIPAIVVFIVVLYFLPPIHSRLAWRLESLRTQLRYLVKPPDEAVFRPEEQVQLDIAVTAMMQTLQATLTPQATASGAATATPQPGPTAKPTFTTTPLPVTVMLDGKSAEMATSRTTLRGSLPISMPLNAAWRR